jgi:hypothetical protein
LHCIPSIVGTALACNGIFEVATTIPIPIAMAAMIPITTSFLIFFSLMTLLARFRRSFCFIFSLTSTMVHAFIVFICSYQAMLKESKKWP